MSEDKRIPKSAVGSLLEYCNEEASKTGSSAPEMFRNFLELMKKFTDYFFSVPWPEKADKRFEFSDLEVEFLDGSKSYKDECERFTMVCLRRNISMEGFDSQGFREEFEYHGRVECWDCSVGEVTKLKKFIELMEKHRLDFRWEMGRKDKMRFVNLRLLKEDGGAKGKSCEVRNKYRCPYGEGSEKFIEAGRWIKALWRVIEWYDHHWNPSSSFRPSIQEKKWYHYDEPGILDVTSYDDIIKAVGDGRLERIIEERRKYEQEYKG